MDYSAPRSNFSWLTIQAEGYVRVVLSAILKVCIIKKNCNVNLVSIFEGLPGTVFVQQRSIEDCAYRGSEDIWDMWIIEDYLVELDDQLDNNNNTISAMHHLIGALILYYL